MKSTQPLPHNTLPPTRSTLIPSASMSTASVDACPWRAASSSTVAAGWLPLVPHQALTLGSRRISSAAAALPSPPHDAIATARTLLAQGARFTHHLKSGTETQVKRSILLFYVPDKENNGAGKLYWSERSRRSLSSNRCLSLDRLTDIYLGAQTAVLKKALQEKMKEQGQQDGDSNNVIASTAPLMFSLLTDTSMLDLEAPSMEQLCYWLWALSTLLGEVREIYDGAAATDASIGGLNSSFDGTSHDDTWNGSVEFEVVRRQTRKFSVIPTVAAGSRRGSEMGTEKGAKMSHMTDALSTGMADMNTSLVSLPSSSSFNRLTTPLANLRSSYTNLSNSLRSDLQGLHDLFTSSIHSLADFASSNHARLASALYSEQRARKQLQNRVLELQGNIRVFARVRPRSKEEEEKGETCAVDVTGEQSLVLHQSADSSKTFEFDRVFGPGSSQMDVFQHVSPLVQSAVDGFSVCCFAYGQTGAGKSYTMEGPPSDRGVNYRSLSELFKIIAETSSASSAAANGGSGNNGASTYEVKLSVMEIYNETIRDLLVENAKANTKMKLDIRHGPHGVYVPDLTELPVHSADEVLHLLSSRAHPNRSVGATAMNAHSSRSHLVLQVRIEGTHPATGERSHGKLVLVDLAGSERINRSGVEGAALKEAQAINTSLAALGNVIAALQSKQGHIPYRNRFDQQLEETTIGESLQLQ